MGTVAVQMLEREVLLVDSNRATPLSEFRSTLTLQSESGIARGDRKILFISTAGTAY